MDAILDCGRHGRVRRALKKKRMGPDRSFLSDVRARLGRTRVEGATRFPKKATGVGWGETDGASARLKRCQRRAQNLYYSVRFRAGLKSMTVGEKSKVDPLEIAVE